MILVDSSVWIDYFNGAPTWQADALDELLDSDVIAVGDLVLAEVLQGFRDDGDCETAKRLLCDLYQVQLGGTDIALEAASNFRLLRSKGVTVRKTVDTFIATACIRNGWTLLHNDRDFEPFVQWLGLRCVKNS